MKSEKPRKPKLSGFQRRKLQREKEMNAPPQTGEVLRRVRVGQLETLDQWRRQIGQIYREMRFHTIKTEIGTRLVYVAEIGARLAKMQEELKELESLRQQLEAIRNGDISTLNGNGGIDYLPAARATNTTEDYQDE